MCADDVPPAPSTSSRRLKSAVVVPSEKGQGSGSGHRSTSHGIRADSSVKPMSVADCRRTLIRLFPHLKSPADDKDINHCFNLLAGMLSSASASDQVGLLFMHIFKSFANTIDMKKVVLQKAW